MNFWSHHFSQNMNEKLLGFLPCGVRAEILKIFCSCFGRNDDLINSFWNLLTFSSRKRVYMSTINYILRTCGLVCMYFKIGTAFNAEYKFQNKEIVTTGQGKEVQTVFRLFLVNCYLLHVPRLPSQSASNVGVWVIDIIGLNWLDSTWRWLEIT